MGKTEKTAGKRLLESAMAGAAEKKPRRKNHPEADLQKACADYLTAVCQADPLFRALVWWHTPNGGWRTAAEAGMFKVMGVRAGVADFVFVLPPHGRAAAIELKIPPNKPTPEQVEFASDVLASGGLSGVAYNLDQFIELVTSWLENERIIE